MELNTKFPGHVYMDTCEDGFLFLAKHYSGMNETDDSYWFGEQRKYLDKSVTDMKFHFFKVPPEEMEEGVNEHWGEGGKYSVASAQVLLGI